MSVALSRNGPHHRCRIPQLAWLKNEQVALHATIEEAC